MGAVEVEANELELEVVRKMCHRVRLRQLCFSSALSPARTTSVQPYHKIQKESEY